MYKITTVYHTYRVHRPTSIDIERVVDSQLSASSYTRKPIMLRLSVARTSGSPTLIVNNGVDLRIGRVSQGN